MCHSGPVFIVFLSGWPVHRCKWGVKVNFCKLLSIFPFMSVNICLMDLDTSAQRLKNLPAKEETWVQSLGQKDPLEKEKATLSSILAWRIPWIEEPGELYSSWGCERVRHDLVTKQQHVRFIFNLRKGKTSKELNSMSSLIAIWENPHTHTIYIYIIENKIIVIVALDGEIMENFISPFCFSVSF